VGTRTLVLLRHGHYDTDKRGGLTSLGRDQARAAAQWLATIRVHAVWSSTLPRAKETAAIVVKHAYEGRPLKVKHTGLLREGIYTRVEGYEIPASEQREDRTRADAAYMKFFRPSRTERTELIVCHGNLIRYLVCKALHTPVAKWLRMTTNHCGITRVLVRDTGAVRVMSYNETAHLPNKLVT
jgi:serine/threonine-protein phosphatase PGAM5